MIDVDAYPRRRIGRRIGIGILALLLVGVLAAAIFVWVKLPKPSTDLADPPRGTLTIAAAARGEWTVGEFTVTLDSRLHVTHPDAAADVWDTPRREAFMTAGVGDPWIVDDLGLARVSDRLTRTWTDQRIESAEIDADGALVLRGTLTGDSGDRVAWDLTLAQGAPDRLDVAASVTGDADRLYLTSSLGADEGVHGFGAQSAAWDLRGRRIALVPREQGIGRGEQPLSFLVDLAASAAGGQDTSYAVSGVNVTDRARSFAYRGDAISSVDLRPRDRMTWEVWSDAAAFSLAAAQTPIEALKVQSTWTGAALPPPAWASAGLIAGLQGGTSEVRAKIATLQEAGTPIAAVWLQDWVGRRTTSFGDRLQWNWTLDANRYPGWEELVAELTGQGIRVLTYVNPMLSADSGAAAAARGGRDLYAEAAQLGYLARDAHGDVLDTDQHGFTAASVDLTNPDAREWLAQVIADEVAGAGASGWMADFGEGPPPEARLQEGTGIQWRAAWPALWQGVNRRAIELSGLGDDAFVWFRSAGTMSAGAAGALWLGDQTQDWSAEDGLRSSIALAQSLAASGFAQVHGDIGGYTSVDLPVLPDVARSDELVVRWAEASLLQPVFRTHEGNRPDAAAQPAEEPKLAKRIAKLARLFAALAPERARLAEKGPLETAVQHPWMLSPGDQLLKAGSADDELQLGPDVLLAPVTQHDVDSISATLPPGRWKHVWSGAVYGNDAGVTQALVGAPLGMPALFVRDGTPVAAELKAWLVAEEAREDAG